MRGRGIIVRAMPVLVPALLLIAVGRPAEARGVDLETSGSGVDEVVAFERVEARRGPRLRIEWALPDPTGPELPRLEPEVLFCDVQLFRGSLQISDVPVILTIRLFRDGEKVLRAKLKKKTALLGQASFQLDRELAGLAAPDTAEVQARLKGRRRIDRARLVCQVQSGPGASFPEPALSAAGRTATPTEATGLANSFHALGRPARAADLPPLRAVWGWPAAEAEPGPTPGELSCLVFGFNRARPADGVGVRYRVTLLSAGQPVAAAEGRGRLTASSFRFAISPRTLEIDSVEVADVEVALSSTRRVTFARLDCLASAVSDAVP